MRLIPLLFLFCLSLGFAESPYQLLDQTSKAFAQVAKKATPAVVFIKVELSPYASSQGYADPFEMFNEEFFFRFFGPNQGPKERSPQVARGTGFLVSKDGYILTNNHVVQDAEKITVVLNDGREFEGRIIGTDPSTDIALAKIEIENAPYLDLANSDELDVGEWVVAIGNPFELQSTVTVGIVSAVGRNNLNISKLENFIQTDAAINPGNSGGPLLDLNGNVVGINTAIVTRSGGYMGIGFSIPSNMARHVMDNLKESGSVARGYLGIQPQDLTADLAEGFNLPKNTQGVVVALVQPNSPAEKAGLKAGDVITKINGKPVNSSGGLRNEIALIKPNDSATLTILRNQKTQTIKVVLGSSSEDSGNYLALKKIGIDKAEELTDEMAKQMGFTAGGVLVKAVHTGSNVQMAGIRSGTVILAVNNQQVKTPQELETLIQKGQDKGKYLFLVRQGNVIRFINVRTQ